MTDDTAFHEPDGSSRPTQGVPVVAALRRMLGTRATRPWPVGWCVRLDWPDGSHDLTTYCAGAAPAERGAAAAAAYWSRGPVRPVSCTVVPVSRHDWRLHRHRRGCRAPDCPRAAAPGLGDDGTAGRGRLDAGPGHEGRR